MADPIDGRRESRPASDAGFELVDHTADIGVHAWGSGAGAVFEQAALAMCSLMYDLDAVECRCTYRIDVEAPDGELLLAAWLNEVLFQVDARQLLFAGFGVTAGPESAADRDSPWRLHAEASGEPCDPTQHRVAPTVKAATLYGLRLEQSGGRWEAEVVLDL